MLCLFVDVIKKFQESAIFLVDRHVIIVSSSTCVIASMDNNDFQSMLTYAVSNIRHSGLSLKPEQVGAIQAVNCGKNIFVWLLTGFGKSLL